MTEDKILLCLKLGDKYGFKNEVDQALNFLKYKFWEYCEKPKFLKTLS